MAAYFASKPETPRLINLVREREIRDSVARTLASKRTVTNDLINRLGLEKELEGHQGCVNCLQWSENGEVLASASDDMHIFLWNPFTYKKLVSFETGHSGNIFSVNFMPKSNNNIVASGAADARVKVFNLTLSQVLYSCHCHTRRVKRIATVDNVPYLFWSAAEDGLVLQHDLRTPHVCGPDRRTVLIDLNQHIGNTAEAKCMAVNALRPELIAVGANDPYIRMYDRRMIKLSQAPVGTLSTLDDNELQQGDSESSAKEDSSEDGTPFECAQYFVAGFIGACHLFPPQPNNLRSFATTYLTFSGDGTELLVNMGGEQIYLFDILKTSPDRTCRVPPTTGPTTTYKDDDVDCWLQRSAYGTDPKDLTDYPSMNVKVLPDHVEELKLEANKKFQSDMYAAAVKLYNKALGFCPMASVLYGNRAAALMNRRWDGDIYAAFRDCQTTLLLDPEHVKAHFRLARCALELNRPWDATSIIADFQQKFPEYAVNAACRALEKDIVEAMYAKKVRRTYDYGQTLSRHERAWRNQAIDYKLRYCGHCNISTDIKEANFFGSNGQYIVAGSDDGNIFIWDRYTTNIVKILGGDSRIVNCLQPHPSSCFLATSGIDPVIRLWSPLPEIFPLKKRRRSALPLGKRASSTPRRRLDVPDDKPNSRAITDTDDVAQLNQIRMYSGPFALMMMTEGYNVTSHNLTASSQPYEDDDDDDDDDDEDNDTDDRGNDPASFRRTCRPS